MVSKSQLWIFTNYLQCDNYKKNVVDASELLLLLCCMRECLELFVASKIVIR